MVVGFGVVGLGAEGAVVGFDAGVVVGVVVGVRAPDVHVDARVAELDVEWGIASFGIGSSVSSIGGSSGGGSSIVGSISGSKKGGGNVGCECGSGVGVVREEALLGGVVLAGVFREPGGEPGGEWVGSDWARGAVLEERLLRRVVLVVARRDDGHVVGGASGPGRGTSFGYAELI